MRRLKSCRFYFGESTITLDRIELQKAYAEKAKTIGYSARSAIAEMIVEMVQPNHVSLDVFSSFMPVEQLQPGDNITRRVRKGKYTPRTMVPGSVHLTDVTTLVDQYAYMFDRLIVGTNANLWEIQSGDIGTVDEMKSEMEKDLVDAIVGKVFTLLGTLWSTALTPNNYADASSGGLTATVLDAMIENIIDEAGSVKSIVGTRKALLPVYSFAGYKEYALTGTNTDAVGLPIVDKLNEFANTNRVSSYHGVTLVELPNTRSHRLPDFQRKLLDTTKVLVIGDNPGKIALMGGFETQDFTDMRTQPANYVLHGWQAYAMLVDMAENIGVIRVAAS